MNDKIPTNQPIGACGRGEHVKCMDADQTCPCRCHAPNREHVTDLPTADEPRDSGKATVDDLERVSAYLEIPGHVLLSMRKHQKRDGLSYGDAYNLGYKDGQQAVRDGDDGFPDVAQLTIKGIKALLAESTRELERRIGDN